MMSKQPYIRHISGVLLNNVQRCVVCGLILTDHRNVRYLAGGKEPSGWSAGPVYVRGNFWVATEPENEPIEDCKP
jgi:hypothetical protein